MTSISCFGVATPFFDFFLEGMKDVDHPDKANGIDGPVGIAGLVIDHFQDAASAKAFKPLARGCSSPFCASLIAKPMTRRTSSGNTRMSSLDDPIHTTGF